MSRKTDNRTACPAARLVLGLAMLAVVVGGIASPERTRAATSPPLPGNFVTYPLTNGGAADLRLGPDGQWWIPPASGSTIDRLTTSGVDSPVQWSTPLNFPQITAGSDGNLWMTDTSGIIYKVSPAGALLATYPVAAFPFGPVLGPDGNVWFAGSSQSGGQIGRITPSGVTTLFPWPGEFPFSKMTVGPDGNLWAIGIDNHFPVNDFVAGRVTPSGVITAFPLPSLASRHSASDLAAGADGNLWYADSQSDAIGRITPTGNVTLFVAPTGSSPDAIGAGPDGNLWFGDDATKSIGRITTSGQIGLFDVSSVGSQAFPTLFTAGPDGRVWMALNSPARVGAFEPFAPNPSPPQIRDISTRYSLPPGGGQVTITGYDVGFATQVFFGSTPATSFSVLGPGQIVATVPPHAVGAVDVTVDTPYGTSVTSAPTSAFAGSHFYYQATNCGTAVSQDTHLSGDIGPCYTGGVTVTADNVTLNLGGHGVVGFQDPRDGSVVGIDLPQRSGVTVTNGSVSGFNAGIHVGGGSGNTVATMQIHDNIGADNVFTSRFGDGIMIEHGSSKNQIAHNVINHNGVFDGIGIFDPGSDGNTIVNNVVENTVGPSGHGPAGEGIIINGTSGSGASTADRGEQVINNVVRNNASGGIANINEIGGTIEGNHVTGNGRTNSYGNGIGVQVGRNWNLGPTQMLIDHNDVRGNGVDGIRLGTFRPPFNGSVEGNTLSNNVSADNGTNLSVDLSETFRGPIPVYDLHDLDPTCGTNAWTGNQWGSAGFSPACTSSGGSALTATTPHASASNAATTNSVDPTAIPPNEQAWEKFLEQGRS